MPAAALLLSLLAASAARPASPDAFVFLLQGSPVGGVVVEAAGAGRVRYTSVHVHVRGRHLGTRVRSVTLAAGASDVPPQALWLMQRPRGVGCALAREELTGRDGPHCVAALAGAEARGTLLGAPYRASYGADGRLERLWVGEAEFRRTRADARALTRGVHPPDLLTRGFPVEGAGAGPLALVPPLPGPARAPALTPLPLAEAERLARAVHDSFGEQGPGAADLDPRGEGEVGGCLAHAQRFAARARARVAVVHGLYAPAPGAPAVPHAWVRVLLPDGATRDLDPTLLVPVRPATHLALALAPPGDAGAEAGERWLALYAGRHRVVRSP